MGILAVHEEKKNFDKEEIYAERKQNICDRS